jgi:putative ATP-dependent endonuclease of the OLD family
VTDGAIVQEPEALLRVELVQVRSFRGIDDVVLALRHDLTVLVGRNNAGKSRLLRAVAVACGSARVERDDFTIADSGSLSMIDLVLAPHEDEAVFDDRVREIFGTNVQPTTSGGERVAWRTTIGPSAEGWGARAERRFLTYNVASGGWAPAPSAAEVTPRHLRVVSADLTPTARDLASEVSRPGSSIRRVLDDLEVNETAREMLEAELGALGGRIVDNSAALAAVRERLNALAAAVHGIGAPQVSALPGRLEELVRLIEIALDTGTGPMPMRLHGSGARSLASLQVQSVLYDRRLGRDGTDFPVLPITLIEEPEAHLHPQACFDVGELLRAIPGQVVVSTHSSHLTTVVETGAIRLVRNGPGGCVVHDMTPVDDAPTTPPARRLSVAAVEWEKIRKYVERPFGEVLFAGRLVIGDGASERAFLPHILRAALGARAGDICVVDPGTMSQASPLVKYAEAADIPCVLFVDCDEQGRKDQARLPDTAVRVWATGDETVDGALEEVLVAHDSDWVLEQCKALLPSVTGTAIERLRELKGSYGGPLGRAFVERFPDPVNWPAAFQQLIAALGPPPAPVEATSATALQVVKAPTEEGAPDAGAS